MASTSEATREGSFDVHRRWYYTISYYTALCPIPYSSCTALYMWTWREIVKAWQAIKQKQDPRVSRCKNVAIPIAIHSLPIQFNGTVQILYKDIHTHILTYPSSFSATRISPAHHSSLSADLITPPRHVSVHPPLHANIDISLLEKNPHPIQPVPYIPCRSLIYAVNIPHPHCKPSNPALPHHPI